MSNHIKIMNKHIKTYKITWTHVKSYKNNEQTHKNIWFYLFLCVCSLYLYDLTCFHVILCVLMCLFIFYMILQVFMWFYMLFVLFACPHSAYSLSFFVCVVFCWARVQEVRAPLPYKAFCWKHLADLEAPGLSAFGGCRLPRGSGCHVMNCTGLTFCITSRIVFVLELIRDFLGITLHHWPAGGVNCSREELHYIPAPIWHQIQAKNRRMTANPFNNSAYDFKSHQ